MVFLFQKTFLSNRIGHCDGVRAKAKNRQICLARKDNNYIGGRIAVDEWAAGGLGSNPIGELS